MRLQFLLVCVLLLSGCTTKSERDLSACETMNSTALKDACFLNASFKIYDLKVCDSIRDKNVRSKCIKNVAVGKSSPEICDEVLDPNYYAECITGVAVAQYNHLPCKRITNRRSQRDACENAVGAAKHDAGIKT